MVKIWSKHSYLIHFNFTKNLIMSTIFIILEEEVCHRVGIPETKGGVSIQGLWEIQTEAIIDVVFGYADKCYWKPVIMDKLLAGW